MEKEKNMIKMVKSFMKRSIFLIIEKAIKIEMIVKMMKKIKKMKNMNKNKKNKFNKR